MSIRMLSAQHESLFLKNKKMKTGTQQAPWEIIDKKLKIILFL